MLTYQTGGREIPHSQILRELALRVGGMDIIDDVVIGKRYTVHPEQHSMCFTPAGSMLAGLSDSEKLGAVVDRFGGQHIVDRVLSGKLLTEVEGRVRKNWRNFNPQFIDRDFNPNPVESDHRADELQTINFGQVRLISGLDRVEAGVSGQECYDRLKTDQRTIRLGSGGAWALYRESDQKTLEYLYRRDLASRVVDGKCPGIAFFGDLYLSGFGNKCVLTLTREAPGKWVLGSKSLEWPWGQSFLIAVI